MHRSASNLHQLIEVALGIIYESGIQMAETNQNHMVSWNPYELTRSQGGFAHSLATIQRLVRITFEPHPLFPTMQLIDLGEEDEGAYVEYPSHTKPGSGGVSPSMQQCMCSFTLCVLISSMWPELYIQPERSSGSVRIPRLPTHPYSYSFLDSLSWRGSRH